jgi:colanic acid/amylovoran biosynthesis glycosyltransferase
MTIVCAHYLSKYLATTLNWLYALFQGTETYEAVVLARTTDNLESFPVRALYALSQADPLNRAYNLAIYKTRGYFPMFYRAAKRHGAGLLHVHLGYDGYKMLPLKRKLKLPMITGFFGIDASKYVQWPEWRKRYQRLFEEGDCFLALGPDMRETLIRAGCPAHKLRIFHAGIAVDDYPFRTRIADRRDETIILMGATFREKKGIRYAIEAASTLQKRSVPFKLIIAGDGELRPQIEQQIADLDLGRRVELLGYLAPLPFRKLMERSHIVILPSVTAHDGDTEGTPLVLIEALAMGIPVVATRHADIPEIVKDGSNGFLVPERDADALAERLIHLIEHPDSWGALGRAGRAHVAEHFNADAQRSELLRIYADVMARWNG